MNGEKPGTLAGGVDGLKPGYVYGWAWRPNDPFEKVEVELLADGEVVAEATACLTRLDLGAAGIGNGQHGFELPFTIAPDSPPVIHMIVRAKNGPTLHNGEFDLQTDGEQIADLAASQTVAQLEQVFGAVTLTSTPAPRPQPSAPAPKLNFVLHAANADRVRAGLLGMAEYSYVFVMNGFAEVLRRLGTVHLAPELAQVDAIFDACLARGEACMLFSFAPPQRTPLGLRCPTIPVIAWEYGTIPTGGWPGDAREDWRLVLRQTGRAIAISDFAARALRAGMGADYPVAFVPTPVWDRLHSLRRTTSAARSGPTRLALEGFAWDSQTEAVPTGDRPHCAARQGR
jgi:hypothetical protein